MPRIIQQPPGPHGDSEMGVGSWGGLLLPPWGREDASPGTVSLLLGAFTSDGRFPLGTRRLVRGNVVM